MNKEEIEGIKKEVRFYDTLDRKVKEFKPVNKNRVLIYVCGPTVYDKTHIGHARVYIFFDSLVRFLKVLGYKVKLVINFTDIDDKIIKKANEKKIHWEEISDKYERYFIKAMKWLKVKEPTVFTRATRHITDIIEYVNKLIDEGYAYIIKDGVYFNVKKFDDYGKLSKQKLEDIEKHYRIEPNPYKVNKSDFALWKFKKENEPYWYSLWKEGRPGWHIECSVMILKHLGEQIDIHGGGEDLIFPHHENEIAQTESLTKKRFVNFWMHVGLVKIKGEKMSKSLGNIITIDELKKRKYKPELIRFYILKTHYKKPLDFSFEELDEIKKSWEKIVETYYKLHTYILKGKYKNNSKFFYQIKKYLLEFLLNLANNFDTPKAYKVLFEFRDFIEKNINEFGLKDIENSIRVFDIINSILEILPKFDKSNYKIVKLVNLIIEIRNYLRKEKKYELSDKIREELYKLGIKILDKKDESEWYFVE